MNPNHISSWPTLDMASRTHQLGEIYLEVTGEKIHGLNETQQRLRQKGYDVPISKAGLGFDMYKMAQPNRSQAHTGQTLNRGTVRRETDLKNQSRP